MLTFEYDDLDLTQRVTDIVSRQEVDLTSRFSRNITLRVPIVSAAMDTVTGSGAAIALADAGGIGVLHRACTAEQQAEMVRMVKRATNYVVEDVKLLTPGQTAGEAREVLERYLGTSGLLVVERRATRKVVGVLSRRDLAGEPDTRPVRELMNAGGHKMLVTAPESTTMDESFALLHEHRIEKLPLVDAEGRLVGLITEKDIEKVQELPNATRDEYGRLMVAAAIGVEPKDCFARAELLVEAGVDALVIDVAHGGLVRVGDVLRELVQNHPNTDIVAGNVMSAETMRPLVEAGAAGIKAGIAPGYACRTRDVTGVGGGQATVVAECAALSAEMDIPVCADGGIRHSGDIGKALALGAESVMVGSLFAGTEESPGEVKIGEDGRRTKTYRGMASASASFVLKSLSQGGEGEETLSVTPEGAELEIPFRGKLSDVLMDMEGALRSTMSYIGARTVAEMPQQAVWRRKARSGQSR